MKTARILLLPGDGVGPEVIAQAEKICGRSPIMAIAALILIPPSSAARRLTNAAPPAR